MKHITWNNSMTLLFIALGVFINALLISNMPEIPQHLFVSSILLIIGFTLMGLSFLPEKK